MRKKFFFTTLFILFYVGILEILLRIAFPIPEVINFNRIYYSPIIHVSGNKLQHLSNTAFTWASDPDGVEFTHNLNIYGFRDRKWKIDKPDQDFLRVMFIGDSFVEGFMADGNETIPQGFVKSATEDNRNIESLNLGVGASQIKDYFKLIVDAVPLFKPDYLILMFYANDFVDIPLFDSSLLSPSFTPEFSSSLSPRLYYIIKDLMEGNTVPHVWRSSPFPYFDPVPDPRNPWSAEKNGGYFNKFVAPEIAHAMKKGRFNPYVVNFYIINKKQLVKPFNIIPHLTAVKRFVHNNSSRLLICYIPSRNQVSDAYLSFESEYCVEKNPSSLKGESYQIHADILEKSCRKLKIPFFDLTPIFREYETKGIRLYWNYDEHMKGKGYLLTGKHLYEWFEKQL